MAINPGGQMQGLHPDVVRAMQLAERQLVLRGNYGHLYGGAALQREAQRLAVEQQQREANLGVPGQGIPNNDPAYGGGGQNVQAPSNYGQGGQDGSASGTAMPAFQNFGHVGLHGEVADLRLERERAYNQGRIHSYEQLTRQLAHAMAQRGGQPQHGALQGEF